jgi:hypothetical protein
MNSVLLALLLLVQGIAGPTGTVEGRVLNQDGTPAANIRVSVQAVQETVLSSIVQTDANGRYRLENVTPGSYYIGAGLIDFPTYYPGVIALSEARVVNVAARSALTGIDFSMARPAGLKVSGRVIREGNALLAGTPRVLMTGQGFSRNVTIPPDGAFEFAGLSPGKYTIGVSPTNGSTPQQILLNDKDVQVELLVPITVAVTGTLAVVDDGPRPRHSLVFDGAMITNAPLAPNGTYSVQLRPGNYRITSTALPTGYFVKSITSGTKDVLNDGLSVVAGAAPSFVVTLDVSSPPPWAKVSGRIRGVVISAINIASVSMSGGRLGEPLQTPINLDGTFEFPRVLPGVYTVRANLSPKPPGLQPLPITVESSNLENLEIVVPRSVELAGRVIMEGGVMDAGPSLSTTFAGPTYPVPLDTFTPDGRFVVRLPEGEQRLSAGTASTFTNNGYVVTSMTHGSTNLLTAPITIDDSSPAQELRITVGLSPTAPWKKVTGRVTGLPPGVGSVGMYASVPGIAGVPVGPNGEFEIPRILPGKRVVAAHSSDKGIDVIVPVVVGAQDVAGVEIPFPVLKSVALRVDLEPAYLGSSASFQLDLRGKTNLMLYSREQPDKSRVFHLPLGEWRLAIVGLPPQLVVKSVTYGKTDLLGARTILNVSADDTHELRVVLAPAVGSRKP